MADEAMDTKTWGGIVAVVLSALGLLVTKSRKAANVDAAKRIPQLEERIAQLEEDRARLDHDREIMETTMRRIQGDTQATIRMVDRIRNTQDERWNIVQETLERMEQVAQEALRMVRLRTGSSGGEKPSRMD